MTTLHHTAISTGAAGNSSIVNAPLGQLDQAIDDNESLIEDIQAGDESILQLNFGSFNGATIAAGAITVIATHMTIDTEGGAATDNLDTINGGADGDFLRLRLATGAHQVCIRHGVDNILLPAEADFWLDNADEYFDLMFDGANWVAAVTPIALRGLLNTTMNTAATLKLPDKVYKSTDPNNGKNIAFLHVMPRPTVRGSFVEQSANATYATYGIAAGTSAGAGALSALTGAQAADDIYTNQAIAAAGGTFGGRRSTTFNLWRRQHNPLFYAKFRPRTAATNLRFWVGLTQAQVTNVDTLAAGTAGFFLRFSTIATDPAWMAICNDGTNQSTPLTTGVAFAIDTTFEIMIWVDSANALAYFVVNDSTPVSVSANLPTVTQDLGWTCSEITTTATAKDVAISRIYGEFAA